MLTLRSNRSWKLVLAACVAAVMLAATAPDLRAQQPPAGSQDGFVPVDQLPADESLPAAPLVIAAYAVAWLAVFLYLWSIWNRLARVEKELTDVSRRMAAGGRR